MDRRGLFLLEGLEVVFREAGVNALLHLHGLPQFGRVFMKRHGAALILLLTAI